MADFEKAIPLILKYEGGYVYLKADPGGETNLGITDKLDGTVDHRVDVDGDGMGDVNVKDLTVDQAKQVYKRVFWDKMLGDSIQAQSIANIVFDAFVNTGVHALHQIQTLLHVKPDGVFGPATITALNLANEPKLYTDFKQMRRAYYNGLVAQKPELKVFLRGWLNRVDGFKDY